MLTLFQIDSNTTVAGAAIAYLDWLKTQVEVGGNSKNTYLARQYGLRFLGDLGDRPLGNLKRSEVIVWAEGLARVPGVDRRVPKSLDFSAIRSLQALLGWCADRDACLPGIALRVHTGYQPQPGRALCWDDLLMLRQALADRDVPSSRDQATQVMIQLLRVLADDGPRGHEIRLATPRHFDRKAGVMRWRFGKNRKPRIVVLSSRSQQLLAARAAACSSPTAYLFANPDTGKPVTHQACNKLLKRIAGEVGLDDPDDLSVHDFRHTFATLSYEMGCSIEEVASALSHTSTATTRAYYLHNAVDPKARKVNAVMNPAEMGGRP